MLPFNILYPCFANLIKTIILLLDLLSSPTFVN